MIAGSDAAVHEMYLTIRSSVEPQSRSGQACSSTHRVSMPPSFRSDSWPEIVTTSEMGLLEPDSRFDGFQTIGVS